MTSLVELFDLEHCEALMASSQGRDLDSRLGATYKARARISPLARNYGVLLSFRVARQYEDAELVSQARIMR